MKSSIEISKAQTEKWQSTCQASLKCDGKLSDIVNSIAADNELTIGNPETMPGKRLEKEDAEDRQDLRELLTELTVKSGYNPESAGQVVSRAMRSAGLAIRAQRDDAQGKGSRETGKPTKTVQLEFGSLSIHARTAIFEVIDKTNPEVVGKSFWEAVEEIAKLGKAGNLPSSKKGWQL